LKEGNRKTEGNQKLQFILSQPKADGIKPISGDTNYFPVSFFPHYGQALLNVSGVPEKGVMRRNPQLFHCPET
jgi:hypothetical protein